MRVLEMSVGGAFSSFAPSKAPLIERRVTLRDVESDIFGRVEDVCGLVVGVSAVAELVSINPESMQGEEMSMKRVDKDVLLVSAGS